jgi:hypothetical protein
MQRPTIDFGERVVCFVILVYLIDNN